MMLKSKSSQSKRSAWTLLRAGLAGLAVAVGGGGLTAGCLDRPVAQAPPKTSNVYVDEIRQTAVDKIDLLFMIDNSISMADKQAILADAVPLLVQRLITPICVRPCAAADNCTEAQEKDGIAVGGNADEATGRCPNGASPEFNPIKDIHVGVITSSLGSHGASGANTVCASVEDNDHAHLLGSLRMGLTSYNNQGFLKWDQTKSMAQPNGKYNPPGDSNSETFTAKFTDMVKSSGERGCGYEASLEAWYRFLIDPDPPKNIVVPAGSSLAQLEADAAGNPIYDEVIFAQRKAFLRPDSLVAVVMLSDENDCSIQDEGYGWLIARGAPMFRATSACAANPNDNCCQSCAETEARSGCGNIKADPECVKSDKLTSGDDPNLRCWQQKRRFGFDLLYPTARYSSGLRDHLIYNRKGVQVGNPLFAASDGKPGRDNGLVFLAGIVGVPWQDIADADSLTGPGLRYLTESQIEAQGRWATILGTSNVGTNAAPVPPTDPLMIEQPEARTGANPITMDALAPATSTNPQQNPINGHEQANMGDRDLQYACIFPLGTPLQCTEEAMTADKGCDCFDEDKIYNRPLCQPPGGGPAGITQSFAKAYPGTRHLQVLKEFKDNSIVASICPKIVDNKTKPDYGYNPAVKAIIDRLKEALKGKCLPRPLAPNESTATQDGLQPGQVPCAVIEAVLPQAGAGCSCEQGGKRLPLEAYTDADGVSHDARPQLREAVLSKLREGLTCGDAENQTKCSEFCTCELAQLSGAELASCQKDVTPPNTPGYCYVNAAPNEPQVGNPDLVKDCSADSKRLLRFVGGTPAQGAIALVACLGASLASK